MKRLVTLPHWPRDTRDTLFILAVIAWTVGPHLSHLPSWCIAMTGGILFWRARLALVGGVLPGRWVVVGVLVLAMGLSFWSFGTLLGKQAGITMLVALVALKTLELRARRDAFVIFFLGFFLVLTHFLYSQSIGVALAMLVSVWGLLTALVLTHMPVGQPALRQAAGLAARTALLGAPVMVLLFVLFPRVAPLWGVPQDTRANTGLSDYMRMGSVAELAKSDAIVMRIRFLDPPPAPTAMYFRGPVLSRFDGSEWRPLSRPSFPPQVTPRTELRLQGKPLRYEVTLEPLHLREIPLLEAAPGLPQREGAGMPLDLQLTDDLRWQARRAVSERVRLSAVAYTEFQHGPTERLLGLQDHLVLPPGNSPRTLEWAAALRRQPGLAEADGRTLAQAVLRHIRQENFRYTLSPGMYGVTDPSTAIDEFWLDRREGFCEHFATAFVVVMRALDVPARIVTGYQGADPLPVDGYHIVRQNSAHAWAEFWQPGEGWVRADPTAAVSPDRINRSATLAAPPGLVVGTLRNAMGGAEFLSRWQTSLEAVNNRWNQWVLSYSSNQQLDLLKQIGFIAPRWDDLAWTLLIVIGSVVCIGLGAGWLRRHRLDPWTTQMTSVRRKLVELGVKPAEHDPPLTLARRVDDALGPRAQALGQALRELDEQRYGSAQPMRALRRQFKHIQTLARQLAQPPG